jgi:hypothetical protein
LLNDPDVHETTIKIAQQRTRLRFPYPVFVDLLEMANGLSMLMVDHFYLLYIKKAMGWIFLIDRFCENDEFSIRHKRRYHEEPMES